MKQDSNEKVTLRYFAKQPLSDEVLQAKLNTLRKFLKEYEALCQKYDMGLNGCGCCGSPYLHGDGVFFTNVEEIYYDSKDKIILLDDKTIDEFCDNVVFEFVED